MPARNPRDAMPDRNRYDGRPSPWADAAADAPGWQITTASRRLAAALAAHRFRRNRTHPRERRMASPNPATGPHGRGHRRGLRRAMVPSQRPAALRRVHASLCALARHHRAEMPPDRVASAGTALGTRCAGNHAHGPHGALPGSGFHSGLTPPAERDHPPARDSHVVAAKPPGPTEVDAGRFRRRAGLSPVSSSRPG